MLSPKFITALILHVCAFCSFAQNLTIYRSSMSVEETTDKLVSLIQDQELVYFETVRHDEIAQKREIEIAPTRVVLFEDPELITRLIECNQTTALELPLKILIWEENEDVYIGFVDPKLMSKRFLLQDCGEVLDDIAKLMVRLSNNVIRPN